MAASERWYFDVEQIHNTPSIKCGYDHDKELSCRQQAANFIQDMGIRLQVNQLCINTAIVYMHRFYMFHSFTRFHRTSLASAALFLAAKVEEQPRKLEHVIRFAQICLHRGEQVPFDVNSQSYTEQVQDLIMNENILLQTLGFDVAIDHPHTHIVRFCQLVNASKELAQTSYFMASYSLHLTTMSLQYKPTVVACFCIHLACKWSNWEIPDSSEGKPWFLYVDKTVTSELLEELTAEFLILFEKCPSRLKRKITALSAYSNIPPGIGNQQGQSQQELDKRKENKQSVDSHNPLNAIPHPIGPLGIAVADVNNAINSCSSAQPSSAPHHFLHHNPMVSRHGNCDEMLKKRPYEHGQRGGGAQPSLPPPSGPEPPYKKHHHPSHHPPRESHGMSLASSSNKPSCMFDPVQPAAQVQHGQPLPHKSSYPHPLAAAASHLNATQGNAQSNRTLLKLEHPSSSTLPHRPPSSRPPHLMRNGEAHFPEKKYSDIKRNSVETKPPPVLAPPSQMPVRARTRTPPQSISLVAQPVLQTQFKVERSIFSPEEKTDSPPPILRIEEKVIKNSPPPTPKTPVDIKREVSSPVMEELSLQSQSQTYFPPARVSLEIKKEISDGVVMEDGVRVDPVPPQACPPVTSRVESPEEPIQMSTHPRHVSPLPSIPPSQPDTPSSKSSHKKKKKKHKDHKDKHKVKHKHKHKMKDPEPIVITIPKDKITISHPEGLKIKIAKEKISNPSSGLKLKISKDKLKESKKRDRSDAEEDDVQHTSKQHRPNGTTTLQVTQSNNPFTCVLGKSLLSPIQTPPKSLPSSSPPSPSSPPLVHSDHHPIPSPVCSPSPTKPCLSPLAATPSYTSPRSNSPVAQLSNISPVQSKPFLSPIAATPRRIPKPPVSDLSQMSPIRSKPFLSPIAPTPRYPSSPKTNESPVKHVYVPLVSMMDALPVHASPSSPLISDCDASRPCLSPPSNTCNNTSATSTSPRSPHHPPDKYNISDEIFALPQETPPHITLSLTSYEPSLKKITKISKKRKHSAQRNESGHSTDEYEKVSCDSKVDITCEDKTLDDESRHNRTPSPQSSNSHISSAHEELNSFNCYDKSKTFLSEIMTPSHSLECNKCLSPIMTPSRSPVEEERRGKHETEPCCDVSPEQSQQVSANKGPHTPPGPSSPPSCQTTSYIYNPITPLRPDPNEIIFKDSNDNHMKQPYSNKRQAGGDRRQGEDRYKKAPLLPDFKIPRVSGHSRRMPHPEMTSWAMRGRGGRMNQGPGPGYNRGRGTIRNRGRWEPPQYRHRLPIHHNDARHYFQQSEDHNNPFHVHMQQIYPDSVLQGNAYDSAIMKHAYESMAIHPDAAASIHYYMAPPYTQQQVFVPSYPPPPPLPQEPPPPQPPPPPPPS